MCRKQSLKPPWEARCSTLLFQQSISHSGAVNWNLQKAVYFLLESRLLQRILQWAFSRCSFVRGTQTVYYVVSRVEMWEVDLCLNGFQSPLFHFSYCTRKKKGGGASINSHISYLSPSCMSVLNHANNCMYLTLNWQKDLIPLLCEMTPRVSSWTSVFGFTCWHLCYCYLMAPLRQSGSLDRSPAELKGLLNMIPVWRSCSVLAARFPGESRAGKLPPLPLLSPPLSRVPTLFLSRSCFFCAPQIPTYPRG